jgi:hypothetical protein
MKLEGYISAGTISLDNALLNVARKLKMTRSEFWEMKDIEGNKKLADVGVANKIQLLITLANKLYKQ